MGTPADPYVFRNFKLNDLTSGYGLKVDNSRGGVTKSFDVDCVQSTFQTAPPKGATLLCHVGVRNPTRISNVSANSGEDVASTGVRLDSSANVTLDSPSINKFGVDGVQVNASDHITILHNKLKAMHTGGILLDGAGTFSVTLLNGVASGNGPICPMGVPTGDKVDTNAGIAVINGVHDINVKGYTINGNVLDIMNGGNSCTTTRARGCSRRSRENPRLREEAAPISTTIATTPSSASSRCRRRTVRETESRRGSGREARTPVPQGFPPPEIRCFPGCRQRPRSPLKGSDDANIVRTPALPTQAERGERKTVRIRSGNPVPPDRRCVDHRGGVARHEPFARSLRLPCAREVVLLGGREGLLRGPPFPRS